MNKTPIVQLIEKLTKIIPTNHLLKCEEAFAESLDAESTMAFDFFIEGYIKGSFSNGGKSASIDGVSQQALQYYNDLYSNENTDSHNLSTDNDS